MYRWVGYLGEPYAWRCFVFWYVYAGRGFIYPFRWPGGYQFDLWVERLQLGLDLTALCSGAGYMRISVSRVMIRVRMRGMGVVAPYVL